MSLGAEQMLFDSFPMPALVIQSNESRDRSLLARSVVGTIAGEGLSIAADRLSRKIEVVRHHGDRARGFVQRLEQSSVPHAPSIAGTRLRNLRPTVKRWPELRMIRWLP